MMAEIPGTSMYIYKCIRGKKTNGTSRTNEDGEMLRLLLPMTPLFSL